MDFVETYNIELDLLTIYFSHFSGCWASFVYSCHSILEYYNLFKIWARLQKLLSYLLSSGVKLSIRSFCFIIKKQKLSTWPWWQ